MNTRGETLMAWSGPVLVVFLLLAWVFLVDWFPPPPASLSAEQLASVFKESTASIRTGMLMLMYGGALNITFGAIIMVYMLRMKGPTPALAYTQLASTAVNALITIIPAQLWGAVAFRPDRMPEISQFGNDFAWLLFDMVNSTTITQWVSLGLAILWDRSEHPLFPRWAGFFNLWAATMLIPGSLITYFKAGPFAWTGVLGFYVGVSTFALWNFTIFVLLRKAIKRRSESTDA